MIVPRSVKGLWENLSDAMAMRDWSLRVKLASVGTPIERCGRRVRWLVELPQRRRHPELWDLYLEDRRTRQALAELLGPERNAVDVGAHIGSMLAEIVRLAPRGRHVAFEPAPEKVRGLRRRFPSVAVIEAATGAESGSATFYADVARPALSALRPPSEPAEVREYPVAVVTLDEALAGWDRIDLVKIDVEGAELPTLRGAESILSRHRSALLLECGPDSVLRRFEYGRVDLYDFLIERGYDVYSMIDFVFGRNPMTRASFQKAGTYPYRGFNYVALTVGTPVRRLDP